MTLATVLLAGLFGTAVGSWLNVIVFRLHAGTSFLRGRSACPHCHRTLQPRELIPLVSFALQAGRCRSCRQPISWQYPAVEAITGLLFAAFVWQNGLTLTTLVAVVAISFSVVLFVYDWRYQLVPDVVSLPAAGLAFVGNLALGRSFTDLILGGIIGAGFFLVQYAVSRGRWIGGGDIRIGLFIGFLLGWPLVLMALILAYVSGSVVGLGLIVSGRYRWTSRLPFGTFLTASSVVVLYWLDPIRTYVETFLFQF